jgi:hypothetical protein
MLNEQINKLNPLMIRYETYNCRMDVVRMGAKGKHLANVDKTRHGTFFSVGNDVKLGFDGRVIKGLFFGLVFGK